MSEKVILTSLSKTFNAMTKRIGMWGADMWGDDSFLGAGWAGAYYSGALFVKSLDLSNNSVLSKNAVALRIISTHPADFGGAMFGAPNLLGSSWLNTYYSGVILVKGEDINA